METNVTSPPNEGIDRIAKWVSKTYYGGQNYEKVRVKLESDPAALDGALKDIHEKVYSKKGKDYNTFRSEWDAKYALKKKEDTLQPSSTSSAPALAEDQVQALDSEETGVPLEPVGVGGIKSQDEQRHELELAAQQFNKAATQTEGERKSEQAFRQATDANTKSFIAGEKHLTQQQEAERIDPVVNIGKTVWNFATSQLPAAFTSLTALSNKFAAGRSLNPEYKAEMKKYQKSAIDLTQKLQDRGAKISENTVNSIGDIENPWDGFIWSLNALTQAGVQIPLSVGTGGASSLVQEVGSIYMDGINRIAKEKGITPEQVIDQDLDEPASAIAFGTAAAILDRVGAGEVLGAGAKQAFRNSLKERAKGILVSSGTEGYTEYTQSWLEQLGAGHNWKDLTGDELVKERLESLAQGVVGGGGVGAIMSSEHAKEGPVVEEDKRLRVQQSPEDRVEIKPVEEAKEASPENKPPEDVPQIETPPASESGGEPKLPEVKEEEKVQEQTPSKPEEEIAPSETESTVPEEKESPLETAKKRLSDAKAKAKAIRDAQNTNLGAIKDNLGDARNRARADREVFDAYVNLATEYVKSGVKTIEDFAKEIGEDVNDTLTSAWDVATGKIKKTIVTKRAYEGEIREGVKAELEKIGLTREIENQDDAKARAKKFIGAVGIDNALGAVRTNTVQGASAAYIWNEALESVERKLSKETDTAKIEKLENQQAKLIEEFGKKSLEGGRFISALGDIYHNSSIAYNLQRRIDDYKSNNKGQIPSEVEARFREYDRQLKELKGKIIDAEERARVAEENQSVTNIKESIARSKESKNIKIAAKVLADKVRKTKTARPGIFMSATPASIVFDGAVEAVALSIEAGGTIAQAVADGLAHIKKSKWYQNLADEDRDKAEKAFSAHMEKEMAPDEDPDGKIRIPYSLIRELVERGVDNINDLVTEVKKRVKTKYPDATDREIRDAITQYGKTVNMSQDEVNAQIRKIKRVGKLYSALEDVLAKKRPLRSGLQRDRLDAEERALNKQIREEMKGLPMDEETESKQLKTALDAAKQRIKNQIEDLNREIETGEQVNKSTRTVQQDEELKALIEERDQIKKVHEAIFHSKDLSDDQKIKAAVRAVEKNIEEYERRIKENELTPKKKEPTKETAELKALRDRRDHLKGVYTKMRDEAGVIEKERLERAKTASKKKVADLERRLKQGDFSKKERKPVIQDTDLINLNAAKIRIQEKYDKEFYKNKLENRTKREKIVDLLWEVWGLTRGLRATGELSFILIQGLIQTIAHPIYATTAFKHALKFFASESKTEKWLSAIKAQSFYPVMKQSGLALTEPNAELNAREELFYSGWTNIIWNSLGSPLRLKSEEAFQKWVQANPFRAVERASIGYLDTIRVLRFLDGMEMLDIKGKTFEQSPQDYKDVADAINTLTGRASLGRAEQVADVLTKVFFSPRNWASVMKTSTPYAFYHFGKMTPTARKMAIADFSKFVGLTTAFVAMAAAYLNNDDDDETGVEFDPRSSDFLKIKLGNRRIDPWGGRMQMIVLQARIIMDSVKRSNGEIVPLGTPYKSDTRFGLLMTMATNKLAPSAAIMYKYLNSRSKINKKTGEVTREDKFGNEMTFESEIYSNLYPIYFDTLNELYKDDPSALNGLLAFYAFIGGGVNVYDSDKNKKDKKKKSE